MSRLARGLEVGKAVFCSSSLFRTSKKCFAYQIGRRTFASQNSVPVLSSCPSFLPSLIRQTSPSSSQLLSPPCRFIGNLKRLPEDMENTNMSTVVEVKECAKGQPFKRLPLNAVPVHYDISIKPNFDNFTFEGVENIDIKIVDNSPSVLMNSADIKILKAVWKDDSGKEQTAALIGVDEAAEVLTVDFQPPLQKGTGTLSLEFTGSINDKMKGFYRSKFKGPDGQEKYNGVTQFVATDARRAFPCLDEPAL